METAFMAAAWAGADPWEHAHEQASKFAPPLLSGSRLVSVSIRVARLFTFFHNHQVGFFRLKKNLGVDQVINIKSLCVLIWLSIFFGNIIISYAYS
jgi:hypothetical protein